MNPVDQLSKMFGFTDLPKHKCETCTKQTKAFGVDVCRLGKPAPTNSRDCAFWMEK